MPARVTRTQRARAKAPAATPGQAPRRAALPRVPVAQRAAVAMAQAMPLELLQPTPPGVLAMPRDRRKWEPPATMLQAVALQPAGRLASRAHRAKAVQVRLARWALRVHRVTRLTAMPMVRLVPSPRIAALVSVTWPMAAACRA